MSKFPFGLCITFVVSIILLAGCSTSYLKSGDNIKELVLMLEDKDSCDEGYKKIILRGKEAIPLLIENGSNKKPYMGRIIYENNSSFAVTRPTVGLVSLYLVDRIVKGDEAPCYTCRTPFLVRKADKFPYDKPPYVRPDSAHGPPSTPVEIVLKAQEYYKQWWERAKNLNIDEIKKADLLPLKNTDLEWE